MRKLAFVLATIAVAGALFGLQPLADPWWRPLNPAGSSAGVTYGTRLPSLATAGTNPGPGELAVDTNGAANGGPALFVWNHVSGTWDQAGFVFAGLGLTANFVTQTNAAGTGFADSTITDNGVDVVATGGLITSGPAAGGANSILIDGNNAAIVFEGAVDNFETAIMVAGPAADLVFNIPDYAVAAVNAFVSTGGVIPELPNCVWAENNAIVFEGATANAFENRVATVDVGQTQVVAVPDIGEAAGNFVVSLANAGLGDVGDAGALWVSGGDLWFEGATADALHARIWAVDPLAGEGVFALPNGGAETWAFLVTEAEGNVRAAANGIWGEIGALVWEGTAADAFEFRITADFVGADTTLEALLPAAGASGTALRLLTTLNAMDGNDLVNGLSIEITNADHGGANNTFRGLNIEGIVQDAQANEYALNFGDGWDRDIYSATNLDMQAVTSITLRSGNGFAMSTANGFSTIINDGSGYDWVFNDEDGEQMDFQGDVAVVGAAQNINPAGNFSEISAAAAASVTTITAPGLASGQILTFVCVDANVTFNDSGAVGGAATINLVGAANFTCSQDDVLTLLYSGTPVAGNARWVEVARSVN